MIKQATKKEETRNRLLESASQAFRKHGYAGVGVDGIASKAGVTSGAFYAHLGSKDDAFQMALESGLNEVIHAIPQLQEKAGAKWVIDFVEYYLSDDHVNDLECGCAMASLTLDVIRFGDTHSKTFELKFKKIISLISQGLAGNDGELKASRAWGLLSVCVGGLTFLRALSTAHQRNETKKAIRETALKVAGKGKKP